MAQCPHGSAKGQAAQESNGSSPEAVSAERGSLSRASSSADAALLASLPVNEHKHMLDDGATQAVRASSSAHQGARQVLLSTEVPLQGFEGTGVFMMAGPAWTDVHPLANEHTFSFLSECICASWIEAFPLSVRFEWQWEKTILLLFLMCDQIVILRIILWVGAEL